MNQPINTAYEQHALFFSPAYMEMRLNGSLGPRHFPGSEGIIADAAGRVTFCYHAPNASSVSVKGIGGAFSTESRPLQKEKEGLWRTTLSAIPPGFHYCKFEVDGNESTNPQAPFAYGCHEVLNFFEVPDPQDDTWLCHSVPHGTIHMELFQSSTTGECKNAWIYTPPSYRESLGRRYPVLYLHHGGGENETGWLWQGKINYITDNLIASGQCEEMIIVMTCLYDVDHSHPGEFLPGDFDHLLTADLMPLVDQRYRTLPQSEARAIAGLSMGSYHSAQTACNHPGLFAYIGMLSGSFDDRWYRWCDCREVIAQSEAFKQGTRLFFQSVGTDEARIYEQIQENRAFLRQQGIPSAYYECPGHHDWTVWRKSIRRFLKLLFKEKHVCNHNEAHHTIQKG